jgi:hypothetical protein
MGRLAAWPGPLTCHGRRLEYATACESCPHLEAPPVRVPPICGFVHSPAAHDPPIPPNATFYGGHVVDPTSANWCCVPTGETPSYLSEKYFVPMGETPSYLLEKYFVPMGETPSYLLEKYFVPMGETPSYLWERRPRTCWRNTSYLWERRPRTYRRNTSYLWERKYHLTLCS